VRSRRGSSALAPRRTMPSSEAATRPSPTDISAWRAASGPSNRAISAPAGLRPMRTGKTALASAAPATPTADAAADDRHLAELDRAPQVRVLPERQAHPADLDLTAVGDQVGCLRIGEHGE